MTALPPKPRMRGQGSTPQATDLDDLVERPRWIGGAVVLMTDLAYADMMAARDAAAAKAKRDAEDGERVYEMVCVDGRLVERRVS